MKRQRLSVRIECPWRGCTGRIDIVKDLAILPLQSRFLVHTIVCPKCNNPVGNLEINASHWVQLGRKKQDKETAVIKDPRTGKTIRLKGTEPNLNRYLKKWARVSKTPRRR